MTDLWFRGGAHAAGWHELRARAGRDLGVGGTRPSRNLPGGTWGGTRRVVGHMVSHGSRVAAAASARSRTGRGSQAQEEPEHHAQLRVSRRLGQRHVAALRRRVGLRPSGAARSASVHSTGSPRRRPRSAAFVRRRRRHSARRSSGTGERSVGACARPVPNTLSKSQPAGRLSGTSARVSSAPSGRVTRLVDRDQAREPRHQVMVEREREDALVGLIAA